MKSPLFKYIKTASPRSTHSPTSTQIILFMTNNHEPSVNSLGKVTVSMTDKDKWHPCGVFLSLTAVA